MRSMNYLCSPHTVHLGFTLRDLPCEGPALRGTMTTELEFFLPILTPQMISAIVTHTNAYAQ